MNKNYKSIIDLDYTNLNNNNENYLNKLILKDDNNKLILTGGDVNNKYWFVKNATDIIYFKVTEENQHNFKEAYDFISNDSVSNKLALLNLFDICDDNLRIQIIIECKMDIDDKYSNNYTVDNFKNILLNKINTSEKIEPKIASIIDKNFFNVKSLKEFYTIYKIKDNEKSEFEKFYENNNYIYNLNEQIKKILIIQKKLQNKQFQTSQIVKKYFSSMRKNQKNAKEFNQYVLYMNQLFFHYKQNFLNLDNDMRHDYFFSKESKHDKYPKWLNDVFGINYNIPLIFLLDKTITNKDSYEEVKTSTSSNNTINKTFDLNNKVSLSNQTIQNYYNEPIYYPSFDNHDEEEPPKRCYNIAYHYFKGKTNESEGDAIENIFGKGKYTDWGEDPNQPYFKNLRNYSKIHGEGLNIDLQQIPIENRTISKGINRNLADFDLNYHRAPENYFMQYQKTNTNNFYVVYLNRRSILPDAQLNNFGLSQGLPIIPPPPNYDNDIYHLNFNVDAFYDTKLFKDNSKNLLFNTLYKENNNNYIDKYFTQASGLNMEDVLVKNNVWWERVGSMFDTKLRLIPFKTRVNNIDDLYQWSEGYISKYSTSEGYDYTENGEGYIYDEKNLGSKLYSHFNISEGYEYMLTGNTNYTIESFSKNLSYTKKNNFNYPLSLQREGLKGYIKRYHPAYYDFTYNNRPNPRDFDPDNPNTFGIESKKTRYLWDINNSEGMKHFAYLNNPRAGHTPDYLGNINYNANYVVSRKSEGSVYNEHGDNIFERNINYNIKLMNNIKYFSDEQPRGSNLNSSEGWGYYYNNMSHNINYLGDEIYKMSEGYDIYNEEIRKGNRPELKGLTNIKELKYKFKYIVDIQEKAHNENKELQQLYGEYYNLFEELKKAYFKDDNLYEFEIVKKRKKGRKLYALSTEDVDLKKIRLFKDTNDTNELNKDCCVYPIDIWNFSTKVLLEKINRKLIEYRNENKTFTCEILECTKYIEQIICNIENNYYNNFDKDKADEFLKYLCFKDKNTFREITNGENIRQEILNNKDILKKFSEDIDYINTNTIIGGNSNYNKNKSNDKIINNKNNSNYNLNNVMNIQYGGKEETNKIFKHLIKYDKFYFSKIKLKQNDIIRGYEYNKYIVMESKTPNERLHKSKYFMIKKNNLKELTQEQLNYFEKSKTKYESMLSKDEIYNIANLDLYFEKINMEICYNTNLEIWNPTISEISKETETKILQVCLQSLNDNNLEEIMLELDSISDNNYEQLKNMFYLLKILRLTPFIQNSYINVINPKILFNERQLILKYSISNIQYSLLKLFKKKEKLIDIICEEENSDVSSYVYLNNIFFNKEIFESIEDFKIRIKDFFDLIVIEE